MKLLFCEMLRSKSNILKPAFVLIVIGNVCFQSPSRFTEQLRQTGDQGRRQNQVDELAQRLPEGRGAGDRNSGSKENH